jgi:hypothetical protein
MFTATESDSEVKEDDSESDGDVPYRLLLLIFSTLTPS